MKYILKDLLNIDFYFKGFEPIKEYPTYTAKEENALRFNSKEEALSITERVNNLKIIEVEI